MKKQWFAITITVATATTVLLVLFWLMGDTGFGISTPALATPLSLTVTAVDPAVAPNDLDTPIIITGTGFTAELSDTLVITPPTAYLGNAALEDVTWVNSTTLSATVQWGLEPGVYTLTVVNPDGGLGSLPDAFTVTQGIGMWTTGGPYGGDIVDMSLHPVTPTTVYAVAWWVGVFASYDAGEHWQAILAEEWPRRLSFDAQDPDVIYVGGDDALYRTIDGGSNWESIMPPRQGWDVWNHYYAAAHPISAGVVYLGVCAPDGPDADNGLYRSDDRGGHWVTMTVGLTDTQITGIAFQLDDTNKMLAGTQSGNVFLSTDGGETWHWTARLPPHVERLYFDPFAAGEAWATVEGPGNPWQCDQCLYKSTDPDLAVWTPITVTDVPGLSYAVYSLAFTSDTVWAAGGYGYTSSDGGASWSPTGWAGVSSGDEVSEFAIDPDNPNVVYAGHNRGGVFKSYNGGSTWASAHEGLAGVIPHDLAVSSSDPDTVYASTGQQGILKSNNGGHSWSTLGVEQYGLPRSGMVLAVDPFALTRVYLGGDCPDAPYPAPPCLRISGDAGATWHEVTATLPITFSGWHGSMFAIAPHPTIAGRILAGATFDPPDFDHSLSYPRGGVYVSDDYGESWTHVEPTQPISGIVAFAYDAADPNLIYAATQGTGLWKSADGGASWQGVPAFPGIPFISSVATHPDATGTVYVLAEDFAGSNLYVSKDVGQSWALLTDESGVQVIAALSQPVALYTSCGAFTKGTCRSTDGGQTWDQVPGVPRPTTLGTGSGGGRVAVYVGSPGGAVPSSAQVTSAIRLSTEPFDEIPGLGSAMGGGVYRMITRLPNHWVYLPLVLRGYAP